VWEEGEEEEGEEGKRDEEKKEKEPQETKKDSEERGMRDGVKEVEKKDGGSGRVVEEEGVGEEEEENEWDPVSGEDFGN